jgi:sigma-B regulation protein RsbU (phosphoserine phosphatase)
MCGAYSEEEYHDYEFTIPKNGKLFVYSDGVPEAHNNEDEMLGLDRTCEALNKFRNLDPKDTITEMHKMLDEFEQGRNQFDDITMLCVQYKG